MKKIIFVLLALISLGAFAYAEFVDGPTELGVCDDMTQQKILFQNLMAPELARNMIESIHSLSCVELSDGTFKDHGYVVFHDSVLGEDSCRDYTTIWDISPTEEIYPARDTTHSTQFNCE